MSNQGSHEVDEFVFRAVFELAAVGMALGDTSGALLRANDALQSMFGYSEEELRGRSLLDLLHPEDAAADRTLYLGLFDGNRLHIHQREKRYRRKDGAVIWCRVSASIIRGADLQPRYFLAMIEDITEQRSTQEKLRAIEARLLALIESTTDSMWSIDRDYRITAYNPVFRDAYYRGFGVELAIGDRLEERLPADRREIWIDWYRRALAGEQFSVEQQSPIDGQVRTFLTSLSPIVSDGVVCGIAFSSRDITERKRAEEELRSISLVDELTQLNNRRALLTLAAHQIKVSHRKVQKLVVVFADLDGLKPVNDQFGHEVGDQMIADAAALLRTTFRESDIVGRFGGDEFVVVAVDSGDPEGIVRRLEARLDEFNSAGNKKFKLSMSLGTAVYDPKNPQPLESLISAADVAMYEAKRLRKQQRPSASTRGNTGRLDAPYTLIVEDDDEIRSALKRGLEERGYPCAVAENGERALEVIRSGQALPSVILLDLMMPVMNGWDFLKQLEEDAALSVIPVVVLSAASDLRSLPPEVEYVLTKPFLLEQLLKVIERYQPTE